jgi:acetyl-CoA carboxylase biotin carboxyl carrier protein
MDKIYDQFDIETIEKLADIVKSKELSEITIQDGEKTISIKGKKCPPPMPPMPMISAPAVAAPVTTGEENLTGSEAETAGEISGKLVRSPIVGTFYAAPSPDKSPFVRVGDEVKKGDVIMIIESMKLMNEIQSEYDGIVDRILVSDGQAVEFDQPLMVIK